MHPNLAQLLPFLPSLNGDEELGHFVDRVIIPRPIMPNLRGPILRERKPFFVCQDKACDLLYES